jgi:hypothetical protein
MTILHLGSASDANIDWIERSQSVGMDVKFEELFGAMASQMRPLFHIHVPKCGGGTVRALLEQIGLTPLMFDMSARSFFTQIGRDEWERRAANSGPRRGFCFTGHYRLDVPILKEIQNSFVIATTLRNPIERALSHFNYTIRLAGNPWHDEIVSGQMQFVDYVKWLIAPNSVGPQYSFFDDTGDGGFAYTGKATAEQCLRNLLDRVALLGLADRLDEFAVIVGFLLRRPNILAVAPRNVTASITGDRPLKASLTNEEDRIVRELLTDDLWFYREAVKEYEKRIAHPTISTVLRETLPKVQVARSAAEHVADVFRRNSGRAEGAGF